MPIRWIMSKDVDSALAQSIFLKRDGVIEKRELPYCMKGRLVLAKKVVELETI